MKTSWASSKSGAKWKDLGLSPENCCLVDEMGYEAGSVIMMNDTVPLSCENVDGVPSLRIILDNMCPADQTIASPTCPSVTPCPTCPTSQPPTTCPPPSTCPECQVTGLPFQPELRNGGSSSEGNLYVNGQPVCDDYWDNADARVTCRMLGY